MKKWIFLLACLVVCQMATSQSSIDEESAVTTMMRDYIEYNRSHQEVRGWRIQILVTTDRRQMERVRSNFEYRYPQYELLFSHENPFYHLKTGAFLTQQNARPFLKEMRKDYAGAFVVADEIELSEILKYK